MNIIQQILADYSVVVLDGALATQLEQHGCNLNDPLWSAKVLIENPELIQQVHEDYFIAGADCATTSSYQATISGFMARGMTKDEASTLLKRSIQIAVDARDRFWEKQTSPANRPKPFIAASVGPYGAYLADGSEYHGKYNVSDEELVTFHRERIKLFIEAGADLLACETIPSLQEAKAIAQVLKEFPTIPAWITFSAKDHLQISSGETIAACANWSNHHDQIVAIGVNCTNPAFVSSLIDSMKKQTDKPIIVYPNSGDVYDPLTKTWTKVQYEQDHFNPQQWYEDGAKVIGGCCRTTPEQITSIAHTLRKQV